MNQSPNGISIGWDIIAELANVTNRQTADHATLSEAIARILCTECMRCLLKLLQRSRFSSSVIAALRSCVWSSSRAVGYFIANDRVCQPADKNTAVVVVGLGSSRPDEKPICVATRTSVLWSIDVGASFSRCCSSIRRRRRLAAMSLSDNHILFVGLDGTTKPSRRHIVEQPSTNTLQRFNVRIDRRRLFNKASTQRDVTVLARRAVSPTLPAAGPPTGSVTDDRRQTPASKTILASNKYDRPRNTRTEMYAGRVACCLLVSYVEYEQTGPMDGRTDARPLHYAFRQTRWTWRDASLPLTRRSAIAEGPRDALCQLKTNPVNSAAQLYEKFYSKRLVITE